MRAATSSGSPLGIARRESKRILSLVGSDQAGSLALDRTVPTSSNSASPRRRITSHSVKGRIAVGLAVLTLVGLAAFLVKSSTGLRVTTISQDQVDALLQQASIRVLAQQKGSILIIDPRTGRVRVAVNPQIAFQTAYPPGSTIKPFTALAAFHSSVLKTGQRTLCRERYEHHGFATACSHPRNLPPLDPAEAIAYSCNYYFGKVGERLAESDFKRTLETFGFGRQTGINIDGEQPGRIDRTAWESQSAVGDGQYLLVTPIQLLTAYTAIMNGNTLPRPYLGRATDVVRPAPSQVVIPQTEREEILRGMRGAVTYGTAQRTGLYSLPYFMVGKTGTAPPVDGFRTNGWFIGFAFHDSDFRFSGVELGILVFLTNSHGADAALIAKAVLEEFYSATNNLTVSSTFSPTTEPSKVVTADSAIRVHLVTQNVTREIPLEQYVLGVVAAEGSMEDQPEALRALAIVARTYAVGNSGRHKIGGYDFCSTTHCQRFVDPSEIRVPIQKARTAVTETAGLILRDDRGGVVDSYFGASCGGMTANLQTLWHQRAPSYLRGVPDEFCSTGRHHAWTDVINETTLGSALRSDPTTDVGESVREISVARRDATGRAEVVRITGNRVATVSGWNFKLIVGRALGWKFLKSSRFLVTQSGSRFVFQGTGFGHGLGLCQEGAHVMAERGYSFQQILAKYFPGTAVGSVRLGGVGEDSERLTHYLDILWRNSAVPATRPVLASVKAANSEHFQIRYPAGLHHEELALVIKLLELNREAILRRVRAAGIDPSLPTIDIFLNDTTGDFVARTRQPSWAAAATRAHYIELQPLVLLKKRAILETTIRHELVHVIIDELGCEKTPRWLAEGLAIYVAGEGRMVRRGHITGKLTYSALEETLSAAKTANDMKAAYAAAYDAVFAMVQTEGESSIWKRVAGTK
ncbi:MAG: SpoIID/LytB domain-containing protein [Pyrinomonadaceae bacterium]